MSEPGNDEPEATPVPREPEDPLRSMLRGALREEGPAPDVLAGVQKKLRERSKGKFYADGWSTAKHPPLNTYLITSLLMLAVLGISYALLSPMVGSPEPVRNQPVPVQLIPGK
jgi:hypothetical protein